MGRPQFNYHKTRNEVNRKQRKTRWINAKNLMQQIECANNGDFYCNHEYNPEFPWVWVDFRFFHTRLKRYFAVAMTTLEYDVMERNREIAARQLDLTHPYPECSWVPHKNNQEQLVLSVEWLRVHDERIILEEEILLGLNSKSQMISPKALVKDYGSVAVGLWVSVNKPHIDEHVIREFIARYRAIGEPISPGMAYMDEEVEIVAERINQRYDKSGSGC